MKMQEIFDKVAKHLLDQGRPAMSGTACAYRGEHHTMCAVGCLIKDEFYDRGLEGKNCCAAVVSSALIASGVMEHREDKVMLLLDRLQRIHDTKDPSRWKSELFSAALAHKLSPAVVTLA